MKELSELSKDLDQLFFISHTDSDGYASMVNMLDAVIGVDKIYYDNDMKSEEKNSIINLDNPKLFLNINYPLDFPIDKVPDGKIVFITDTSFTKDTIENLYKIAAKSEFVVWTDHHKTSLWFYDEKENNNNFIRGKIIPILFDGSSSSMTTHYMNKFLKLYIKYSMWLMWRTWNDLNQTLSSILKEAFNEFYTNIVVNNLTPKEITENELKKYIENEKNTHKDFIYIKPTNTNIEPKMYIKLIDDFDIWKHEDEDSIPFQYGLNIYPKSIYFNIAVNDYDYVDILNIGRTIKRYADQENDKISNNYTFVKKFYYDRKHGMVDVLCCNNRGNSFVFGDKIEEYPFCLLYHYDGTEWKYSIYSHKKYIEQGYDASVIARHYGGGGHAGASGFSSIKLIDKLM